MCRLPNFVLEREMMKSEKNAKRKRTQNP